MTDSALSTNVKFSNSKTCKICGKIKLSSEFHGYNKKCKLCFNKHCRERKNARLSDPHERERHNTMERDGRAKRISENYEYHRARENANTARHRERKDALLPPKQLSPRRRAIVDSEPHYFTGKPCVKGHIDFRATKTSVCMECARQSANQYRQDNLEICRQKYRDKYAAEPEKQKERRREYGERNRELVNERARDRVGEKTREACREYYQKNKEARAEYRKVNRGRYNMHANNRREKIIRATPQWVDMDAIAAIYEEAARVSAATGIQHDVDHYYPLKGRTCSGLHVANNLRIIPHSENISKHNRMPTEADGPPPIWPR